MPNREAPMNNGRGQSLSDLRARIEAAIAKPDGEAGCWVWLQSLNRHGYGQISWKSKNTHVHRAYLMALGREMPEGLHVDHLCRNRACVNPDHLELVTCRENLLRGMGVVGVNSRKTHCKNGHEFTPENTYMRHGVWRNCRECARESLKRSRARGKAR